LLQTDEMFLSEIFFIPNKLNLIIWPLRNKMKVSSEANMGHGYQKEGYRGRERKVWQQGDITYYRWSQKDTDPC
jgi:hypothetical protein